MTKISLIIKEKLSNLNGGEISKGGQIGIIVGCIVLISIVIVVVATGTGSGTPPAKLLCYIYIYI